MSKKKIFDLIRGDSIHIAPKTKFIPAEDFSTLQNAIEVLEIVHQDAEKYKIQVADECESLKAQAQQEGFEAGFQAWLEIIAKQEAEILNVRAEIQKVIAPVALKAAKKIVGRELETSEDAIVDIVLNSLKAVSQHKKITIFVNKKDIKFLEAQKPRLRELFEELEVLSIRERADITPGGCVIETEGGIINAQIENQWRVLERAFSKLLTTKNEAAAH